MRPSQTRFAVIWHDVSIPTGCKSLQDGEVEAEFVAKLSRHTARSPHTGQRPKMEILLASSNPHKLQEFQEILEPLGVAVAGLKSLKEKFKEPVEDASTFAGNARLKAIGYAAATGQMCIADDSGLSVDALGGRPGVMSARFSGSSGTRDSRDAKNNALLLSLMEQVPDEKRTARFECAVCLAESNGNIIAETHATFEGFIARSPQGKNGFGYDPLFFLPDVQKTSAQLSSQEKNARSHRGKAVLKIRPYFSQMQEGSSRD